MLTLRKEQIAVLSDAEAKKFIDRVAAHVAKFFPGKVKTLGEQKTRDDIRYGVTRAASYGIKAEREVCLYIDVMFVLGRDFDNDPALDFASRILRDSNIKGSAARINKVHRAAMEFLASRHAAGKV